MPRVCYITWPTLTSLTQVNKKGDFSHSCPWLLASKISQLSSKHSQSIATSPHSSVHQWDWDVYQAMLSGHTQKNKDGPQSTLRCNRTCARGRGVPTEGQEGAPPGQGCGEFVCRVEEWKAGRAMGKVSRKMYFLSWVFKADILKHTVANGLVCVCVCKAKG